MRERGRRRPNDARRPPNDARRPPDDARRPPNDARRPPDDARRPPNEANRGAATDLAGAAGSDPAVADTGTTVVALAADAAAVLAADRRASVGGGRFVTGTDVRKVQQVHPTAAAALSGGVGGVQSFVRALRAESERYATDRGRRPRLRALATYAGGLLREGPYRAVQPLVAGVDDDGAAVYDLDPGGAVLPADYAAKGSGMQVAYGVLEGEYAPGVAPEAARAVAARAVGAASARDTATGDGVTVATVTGGGVRTDVYDDPAAMAESGGEDAATDDPGGDGSASGVPGEGS